jgi:hypothetical protein
MVALLKTKGIELKGTYSRGWQLQKSSKLSAKNTWSNRYLLSIIRWKQPLCKMHRSEKGLVERFEPYINGWELGNAYSRLNDPLLQRQFLQNQVERGRGGEEETHPMDEVLFRQLKSECHLPGNWFGNRPYGDAFNRSIQYSGCNSLSADERYLTFIKVLMIIKTLSVAPIGANCYILACDETKEAIVIDPEENRIKSWVLSIENNTF